ncbi:MAG: PilZ domain-containing protein, partial [Planctomycetes bacterium]|nr:PilZ domain-containing protein [Planctomycetota bacterium]
VMKQRKFPRLNENWKIAYRVIEGQQFDESPVKSLAVNISGGGICFESPSELKPGTMTALEMSSDTFQSPIIALAKVVWCKKRLFSDKFEVGAEFWWVGWQSNEAQNAIAGYVSQKAKG